MTEGARGYPDGAPEMAVPAAVHPPWLASLSLGFRRSGPRCVLFERCHTGPLIVQKTLHPEGAGICHAILIHAPGGIAGGDQLALTVTLQTDCHVVITAPAAAKWYKSNGRSAGQTVRIDVAPGAILEWLPPETILFDDADAHLQTSIHLHGDARYAGWELVCLGRRAAGERFARGAWRQSLQILRDERPIWGEYGRLRAGERLLRSPAGLNGCSVFGGFVAAAGPTPSAILEACRACVPTDGAQHGVTATDDIFSARYLGNSAEHGRHYFEALWGILRPWYAGQAARRPRLWDT